MQRKPLVLVLGGGYAGVRVALDLARQKSAKVILIDKNPYHALPTQYYELATFFRNEPRVETIQQLKGGFHNALYSAVISLKELFAKYPDVEVMQATVSLVRPKDSCIVLADGRRLYYEWLVFALGSQTNYFNIPHLEQNALGLKTPEEALNVRDQLDELFYKSPKQKKITVVIGGGGFTGSELAGEVVGYMRKLAREHQHPAGHWSCVVVEAGSSVLGTSSAWAQRKAKARLSRLGVTFLFDHAIVDVWPNLLYIGQERRPLPFDLLVWTAGVKGSCLGDLIEGIAPSKKNCVPVNNTLRIEGLENIFVAGDVAATVDSKTKTPMPMTAQKALQEAKYISRSLKNLIQNPKAKLKSFEPKSSSFIIPLGGKYALLETPYVKLSGSLIWVLKYIVVFKYLITIMSPWKSFGFLMSEIRLYTKND